MKYFVTGGAGFIGSNYVDFLLTQVSNVVKVTVYDNFTYAGNLRNLEKHSKDARLEIVSGDVRDLASVQKVINGHDVIVHFAAESHVDRSIEDSSIFIQTNVLGTYVMLEAARLSNVSTFIHISTDEVYGSLEIDSAVEEYPLLPNSPYAASKAASDLLARSYFVTHGLDVRITRCCNNYGPNQFPEKLVPVLINAALKGEKFPIYGDGLNVREWIYVEDHCKAIQLVIDKGIPGDVYNIGTGVHHTNLELAQKIIKILELQDDLISFVEDRKGHDYRYSVNSEKLSNLGSYMDTSIEIGLPKTVRWYAANSNWWN